MIPNWMQSSVDPSKVSATVTGVIIMLSSYILFVAQWAHFPLTQNDVTSLASGVGLGVGFIWAVGGAIRKLFVKVSPTNQ